MLFDVGHVGIYVAESGEFMEGVGRSVPYKSMSNRVGWPSLLVDGYATTQATEPPIVVSVETNEV